MIAVIATMTCLAIYCFALYFRNEDLAKEVRELRAEIVRTAGYAETYRLAIESVEKDGGGDE